MKRLMLASALVLSACAAPTTPSRHFDKAAKAADVGDPCTTDDGRSGYIVYSGRQLICQAP